MSVLSYAAAWRGFVTWQLVRNLRHERVCWALSSHDYLLVLAVPCNRDTSCVRNVREMLLWASAGHFPHTTVLKIRLCHLSFAVVVAARYLAPLSLATLAPPARDSLAQRPPVPHLYALDPLSVAWVGLAAKKTVLSWSLPAPRLCAPPMLRNNVCAATFCL